MEKDASYSTPTLSYWIRWQVLVCALIFLLPTFVSVFLINKKSKEKRRLNSLEYASHCYLWIPCWRNLHPKWLLFYRALALVIMVFLVYQSVVTFGLFSFLFYTQWTFVLVPVYFALATMVSVHGCWIHSAKRFEKSGLADKFLTKNSQESKDGHVIISTEKQLASFFEYQLQDAELKALFCGNLMEHIYQACAGAVMLTDIVFWCVLLPFMSDEHFQLTPLMVFMHSGNAVLLILDCALNNLPFPLFGMASFILWSSSYVVIQWAIHACWSTGWPYPFLDLSSAWAPMWYFGLALVHIPCYGFYVMVVKGMDSICTKMFAGSYLRISARMSNSESPFLFPNT